MIIGSEFCTECKDIYSSNRGAFLSREAFLSIKNYFKNDTFITSEDSLIADLWLLVCGCANPCIEHDHLIGKFGKLFVMSENDVSKIIHMIELLKENKEVIDK